MPVIIKVSYNGLKGYLGKGSGSGRVWWQKNTLRASTQSGTGASSTTTSDEWWMTVGTQGANNGYVGFDAWGNAGWPNWKYDGNNKRMMSDLGNGPMSLTVKYDGHVYCCTYAPYGQDDWYYPANGKWFPIPPGGHFQADECGIPDGNKTDKKSRTRVIFKAAPNYQGILQGEPKHSHGQGQRACLILSDASLTGERLDGSRDKLKSATEEPVGAARQSSSQVSAAPPALCARARLALPARDCRSRAGWYHR